LAVALEVIFRLWRAAEPSGCFEMALNDSMSSDMVIAIEIRPDPK
jgi:hypothetical protein